MCVYVKDQEFLVFLQFLTLRSSHFLTKKIFFLEKLFSLIFCLFSRKVGRATIFSKKNFFVKKWLDLSVKKCKKTRNSWSLTYISHKKDQQFLVFICVKKKLVTFDFTLKGTLLGCWKKRHSAGVLEEKKGLYANYQNLLFFNSQKKRILRKLFLMKFSGREVIELFYQSTTSLTL